MPSSYFARHPASPHSTNEKKVAKGCTSTLSWIRIKSQGTKGTIFISLFSFFTALISHSSHTFTSFSFRSLPFSSHFYPVSSLVTPPFSSPLVPSLSRHHSLSFMFFPLFPSSSNPSLSFHCFPFLSFQFPFLFTFIVLQPTSFICLPFLPFTLTSFLLPSLLHACLYLINPCASFSSPAFHSFTTIFYSSFPVPTLAFPLLAGSMWPEYKGSEASMICYSWILQCEIKEDLKWNTQHKEQEWVHHKTGAK